MTKPMSADEFQQAVYDSFAAYWDAPEVLAIEFEVSVSTVWRWFYGKTCPLPRIRRVIANFIEHDMSMVSKTMNFECECGQSTLDPDHKLTPMCR